MFHYPSQGCCRSSGLPRRRPEPGLQTPGGETRRECARMHENLYKLACICCEALVQLELRRELMQDDAVPASPNLDSLVTHRPACKRALVRLLWPKIRTSLEIGHT